MQINYSIFFVFLNFIALGGCKKFVQISPPTTQLVTASVFTNDASATAAQTSIYSLMMNNSESYNMALDNGLLADELTNYSSSTNPQEYYINGLLSANAPGPWATAYNYIYQENAMISGLQSYQGVSVAAKQQLIGEALFTRAFWYFYLINIYGALPLITSPTYSLNPTAERTPAVTIYAQIKSDLLQASNLLNPNYVDATDTTISYDRVRPTKWAALALLARVYLFTNQWDSASLEASAVIGNSFLYNLTSLDSVFLANSNEAIWQLMVPEPSYNNATPDGAGFILIGAPANGLNVNCSTISPQLQNSFEPNDQRRSTWIGNFTSGSDTFYFPYKYKIYQTSGSVPEYEMVLRLSEQYLIRAEAETEQGNVTSGTSGALADLNMIRARAGLPAYTGPRDQQSVLNAILHERQVELFTEWGHRWFDLIRTGNINSVMASVAPQKRASWVATDSLYPIPQTERSIDPQLTQNPGYE